MMDSVCACRSRIHPTQMRFVLVISALVAAVAGHSFDLDSSYEYLQPASFLPESELSNYEWNSIRERMAQAENIGEVPVVTEAKLKVVGGSDKGSMRFKPNGQAVKAPQKAKVDNLPKYCDPPNPCPLGKNANDGCQSDVQDTEEYNRNWILEKQQRGECPCDREHMRTCEGRRTVSSGVQVNEPIVQQLSKMLRNAIKEEDDDSSSDSNPDDDEQMLDVQIPEDAKVVAKKGRGFEQDSMDDVEDDDSLSAERP